MTNQKNSLKSSLIKYFIEIVIVFTGVFAAFLLSEYRETKAENERKREVYHAIYEDLMRFYNAGKAENEQGFINFFLKADNDVDSMIAAKKLPSKSKVFGDFWKIEIINSIINSGLINMVDIETFKKVSRFHTVHNNFLIVIEDYNKFYDTHVTANYDKGMDYFYKPNSNELKPKYVYLNYGYEGMAQTAEILLEFAEKLAEEIRKEHLD